MTCTAVVRTRGIYERLAELPLRIDNYSLTPLTQPIDATFTRCTVLVRLSGAGHEGMGEDVTPAVTETMPAAPPGWRLPLAGDWTIESFSAHLTELGLYPLPLPPGMPTTWRRWAFESAALDLALRQRGVSLAAAIGRQPRPVRFVNSLRLPAAAAVEEVRHRRLTAPGLRFKLDPAPDWSDEHLARLAQTGAVDILDFKGHTRRTRRSRCRHRRTSTRASPPPSRARGSKIRRSPWTRRRYWTRTGTGSPGTRRSEAPPT